ncbi:hypothetical protein D3C85_1136110 [compost metagenome]
MHGDGVGIGVVDLHIGVAGRHVIADTAKERIGAQDIGLVADGHAALAVARRAVALAREAEGKAGDAFHAFACDDDGVGGDFVSQHDAAAAAGVQAFGVFADDDVVDLSGLEMLERRVHALIQPDRPHIGVEVQPEAQAQVQVVTDLGAVGVGHAGHAGRAVQHGVGGLAGGIGVVGQHLAGLHVVVSAAVMQAERQQIGAAGLLQHGNCRPAYLGADAVAFYRCNLILGHLCCLLIVVPSSRRHGSCAGRPARPAWRRGSWRRRR